MTARPELDDHPDVRAAESAAPRSYLCHRAVEPPGLDGRGASAAWDAAPWTEDFTDIEGAARPAPRHRTRVRMLHDDEHLYVHAELEEPHVWGSITCRNQVIFHDNDFEVFLDPDGDNHDYYELEVNALGTLWQLSLPMPYRTGAKPRDPDELEGLRTAVAIDGTLNDPSDVDRGWSVEIALPFAALKRFAGTVACPPRKGDTWRINFSRVQWRHEIADGAYRKIDGLAEDNWVWSPQGIVDMHRPATWGRLVFAGVPHADDGVSAPNPAADAEERVRRALMGVWERMRLLDGPTTDRAALGIAGSSIAIERTPRGWQATSRVGSVTWAVDQDARLTASG